MSALADVSRPRYRLAAVFQRPHPYFCKFFQRLAAHPEIDLTVYFYSDLGVGPTFDPGYQRSVCWDTDLLGGYKSHFLRNYSPRPNLGRFPGMFHPSLLRELGRGYDAAILHGWWGLSSSLVMLSAFLRRIPLFIHSDKNVMEPRGVPHGRLRDLVLPRLFDRVAAFLVVGRCNAAFYRKLGVREEKMFLTPLAVDNAFFQEEKRRLEPQRGAIRHKLGISPEGTVILYVGRLDLQKGVLDLMRAYGGLSSTSAHLMLVGDGPGRPALEAYARENNVQRIQFVGLQNYSQLPASYAISDVFVLPSHRENWGAVINEAMNFRVPIVASRVVGAAADLVEDGANGLLFEPGDVAQLTKHLQLLLSRPELRRRMGEESARRIVGWNFDRGVEGVLAALRSAVPHRHQTAINDLHGPNL